MKPLCILLMACAISLSLPAQVPNDTCSTAEIISSIGTLQSIFIDLDSATESLDASCENASDTNLDLWYSFTMPFDGKLKISGLSTVNKISLYESCGGLELQCNAGNSIIEGLNAGTTYFLRYGTGSQFAARKTIFIQAFAPPSNDDCQQAIAIPTISQRQSVTLDNRGANESLDLSCENASEDNFDLWYSFTMPYDGKIKLSGLSASNKLGIFDACSGNELACRAGNGFFNNLLGGTTYLLRYGTSSFSASTNTMYIQAFAPPSNDFCANAIQVSNIQSLQTLSLDTRGASESLDISCEDAANTNLDVWFTFTMPFDGKVEIEGVFGVNKLALFDACGGNEIACFSSSGFFDGLGAGNTYYLRYASIEQQAINDNITLRAFAPPTNDSCSQAIALSNIQTLQNISLDNRGASQSLLANCDDPNNTNLDLWYSFVMPFDGKIEIEGVFGVNKLTLFDGCGGNELSCFANNGFFDGLLNGNTYYMRYSSISQQAINDDITLQAFPQSVNDFCADAIALIDIQTQQSVALDNRGANQSLLSSCDDPTQDNLDLWYSFTMPFDGKVEIDGVFGVNKIALYDSCGGNERDCFATNGFFDDLLSGTTYYLRYASLSQQAINDVFTLQAFPASLNDVCTDAIQIPNIDSLQHISLDTREANESLDASCEVAADDNLDLWYTFTMPFEGKITLNGLTTVRRIVLYEECGGVEIACLQGSGSIYGLSGNTNYLLRYATRSTQAAADEFSLQAFAPVSHDTCSVALQIEGIDSLQYIITDTREATESQNSSCETSGQTALDLWYTFTMPFNGKLELSEINNAHNISLWDACGGVELGCFSGSGMVEGLTDSTAYVLRYASSIGNARVDSFLLQAVMTVGIEEVEPDEQFSLYPNPATNFIYVSINPQIPYPALIKVFSLRGKKVLERQLDYTTLGNQSHKIPLQGLAKGMYSIQIIFESSQLQGKFVKW